MCVISFSFAGSPAPTFGGLAQQSGTTPTFGGMAQNGNGNAGAFGGGGGGGVFGGGGGGGFGPNQNQPGFGNSGDTGFGDFSSGQQQQ